MLVCLISFPSLVIHVQETAENHTKLQMKIPVHAPSPPINTNARLTRLNTTPHPQPSPFVH